ncbi:hypothetical protein GCM10023238_24320 [Streptomyces heliomycini]
MRRRFGWAPGSRGDSADLTGLEDEHLERGEERVSDIVAREIERPRTGPMRDIAATIQPEQDDLVRGDLGLSVCVQGAPGTGKTAVGLHRAAIPAPHPSAARPARRAARPRPQPHLPLLHLEVLPALGETGVRQSTLAEEIARHPVTGTDDERTAVVKHDVRMAEVLRRALYARVRTAPAGSLAVPDGSYRWRLEPEELARIVTEVRAGQPPYGVGRERVRARIVRAVRERAERRAGPRGTAWERRIERGAAGVGVRRRRVAACAGGGGGGRAAGRSRGAGRRRRGAAGRRGAEGGAVDGTAAVVEVGALVGRGPGAARRGRRAGRAPRGVRARRGRRGPGPLPDGVPGHRPADRLRLAHRAGRPRAGDDPLGGPLVAGGAAAPGEAGRARDPR